MLYFDKNFIDNAVEKIKRYALQRGKEFNVTVDKMWVMFGGFLISSYGKYSDNHLYWSREEDILKLLMSSIRCNRFEDIIPHIHFNDNSNYDRTDRLYKNSGDPFLFTFLMLW